MSSNTKMVENQISSNTKMPEDQITASEVVLEITFHLLKIC